MGRGKQTGSYMDDHKHGREDEISSDSDGEGRPRRRKSRSLVEESDNEMSPKKRSKKNSPDKKEEGNGLEKLRSMLKYYENFENQVQNVKQNKNHWKVLYEELDELKVTRPKQLLQKALALNEKQEDDYKRKKKLDKEKHMEQVTSLQKELVRLKKDLKAAKSSTVGAVPSPNIFIQKDVERLRAENSKLKESLEKANALAAKSDQDFKTAAETACQNTSLSMQLSSKNKLLSMFNTITGIKMELIESSDGDGAQEYTDILCTVGPPHCNKTLAFELAIPHDTSEEVNFTPRQDKTDMQNIPDFFSEEISFSRDQFSLFARKLLHVVCENSKK